jgi:hypothetical protein
MSTSVEEIRSELSAAQNGCFKDYQIQRWIAHKRGCKAAVLKASPSPELRQCPLIELHGNPRLTVDPQIWPLILA